MPQLHSSGQPNNGEPVAFQYPVAVVRLGRPPLASLACLGVKKNHCSVLPRHNSPESSATYCERQTKVT
ncbi:hypothetical protein NC652_022691 [Populus alba x Populus x berolinensis]|uniref:Uncharacterized protein n=1 Tax=Populus alba x Populus x berolinensis TaxID=444605 RepID=A0AAD6MEW3_9ROSI|nr:hypothetical protein NC651_021728 [Populus alba x Populus x berolinensis]KAJ6904740.1 hypothetical protein NC652_022691 [Populus alba x Populus x berolinensis]KAJ6984258.1 hypothetical protein NC653_022499 [Populus alba x Populus x berolinensis]